MSAPGNTLETVKEVAGLVKEAGGRALLVGGCVRDSLLGAGTGIKDYDLEVYGLESEKLESVLSARFKLDLVGRSFGVIKLHHYDIDIALPRRETKLSDPFMPIEDAAARRDFTINAIYRDPLTDEIIDPYGGRRDLEERILRHVSPHFAEDPLRVLRGMQFVARFCLKPAIETIEICRTMTPENLPRERLFEEWSKLLVKGVKISAGLEFLRAVGWVDYYPELTALIGCRQAPEWHPEGDVWNHTLCCLDAFARERGDNSDDENLIVGLAVLCHDFGKPATTAWDAARGRLRSLGHDEAGVAPTLSFLRRLTNEERLLREVPPLVQCHMRPFAMWKGRVGDAAVRRLAVKVGRIDRLLRVAQADEEGCAPRAAGGSSGGEDLRWLAAAAERLRVAASVPKPILMGRHLIQMGYKPSQSFKKMLDLCFDAQLDGKFGDLAGAQAYFASSIANAFEK